MMTLPTNVTLPYINSDDTKDPESLKIYIRRLVFALTNSLQTTNATVNGGARGITSSNQPEYPFIVGSTTAGTAIYTNAIITLRRVNLMSYIWFDIEWAAHTGTGNVLITSPFYSRNVIGFPFVGVVESNSVSWTTGYSYLTLNIAPNTNTIAVDQSGSGLPLIGLPISPTGHLRGSIAYEGQQFI